MAIITGLAECEGFPGGVAINTPANAGDSGSVPGSGRSPGGNGKLLQYSGLGNPTDGGDWQATVHGVAKGQTRLSAHVHTQKK